MMMMNIQPVFLFVKGFESVRIFQSCEMSECWRTEGTFTIAWHCRGVFLILASDTELQTYLFTAFGVGCTLYLFFFLLLKRSDFK